MMPYLLWNTMFANERDSTVDLVVRFARGDPQIEGGCRNP